MRRPLAPTLLLVLLALVAGCSTGGAPDLGDAGAPAAKLGCSTPLRGGRYQMCGKLANAGITPSSPGRWARGSLDPVTNPVAGATYRLSGGIFHAAQ
jgi:hypothetical protein